MTDSHSKKTAEDLKAEILEKVQEYARIKFGPKPSVPNDLIPYAGRVFDHEEIVNLVDSSLEFWLTSGRYTRAFESGLSQYLNAKYTLLTNSGSSANLLAVMALSSPTLGDRRLKRGDEVITVAAGFPTTVAPLIQAGLVPVFVDISLPTYNIDVNFLEAALSSKTKAVMLAHTLGNPFDIRAVKNFCDQHQLSLIEDNCDALGSLYQGQQTGTFGHIGTSSFYPAHQMTTGEGGAVHTNDHLLKRALTSLRDWGRDCWCPSGKDNTCGKRFDWDLGDLPKGYDHKYVYSHFGYNLKATDLQAAIGVAQLKKLPSFVEARRKNWLFLRESLADLSQTFVLPEATLNSDPSWFGFALTLKQASSGTANRRNLTVKHLEECGIQTRMLFAGNLLKHPAFRQLEKEKDYRVIGDLKVTDQIMNQTFWVGVYPGLNQHQLQLISDKIREFAKTQG